MVPLPMPATSLADEDGRSLQDVFVRVPQQAESRGRPAGAAGAVERATVSIRGELNQQGGATAALQPSSKPVIERAPPPVQAHREPAKGAAARRRPADPAAAAERRRSQGHDDTTKATEREARPSRLRSLLLTALIIAVLVGVGTLAWSKRVIIGQIITAFDSSKATGGKLIPPAVPDSGAPGNVAERVTDAGAAPAKVVGPINPQTDDAASPAAPAVPGAAATPALPADAGARPTPGDATADEASPAGPVPPVVASATDNADADGAPIEQKAVLHEEMFNSVGATSINATVTWRYLDDGANGPAIEADLQVPERGMKIKVTIHKNADSSLPASHLVEINFDAPSGLPGKGIQNLTHIFMKPTKEARGQPLVGAEAKITDGFFWIALSGADLDLPRNLSLLRDGEWIDLPFTYETGQRALLTFEKGSPGDRVFQKAMAAWAGG